MANAKAQQVADTIVYLCSRYGDLVSNLKVQKLLYYAQAWHLALYGKPLFDDRMEAWPLGPVQPAVYRRYKQFGNGPITPPGKMPSVLPPVVRHIEDVLKAYGRFSAFDLMRYTHSERPWQEARGNLAPDAPSKTPIAHEAMRTCYKARLK